MKKQIDEIVRDVDKAIRANFAWDVLNGGYVVSSADNIAQELYYAGYRKIYDDHQRQCTCYSLGCQMADSIEKKVAGEFIEAVDKMIELVVAMTGCSFTYFGKYAELKKKYIKDNNTEGWTPPVWTSEMWKEYREKYTEDGE